MARCEYHPPIGQFNPTVEWKWNGSGVNPNSTNVLCAPAVANLNDDNGDGIVPKNCNPRLLRTITPCCNTRFTISTLGIAVSMPASQNCSNFVFH